MKRLFKDNQDWSQDGHAALGIASRHLRAAVAELVEAGYSPRDAGLVLYEQVSMTVILHHTKQRRRLAPNVEAFKEEGPG